eukprot:155618-Prymnesium_polylepis.1
MRAARVLTALRGCASQKASPRLAAVRCEGSIPWSRFKEGLLCVSSSHPQFTSLRLSHTCTGRKPPPRAARRTPLDVPAVPHRTLLHCAGRTLVLRTPGVRLPNLGFVWFVA